MLKYVFTKTFLPLALLFPLGAHAQLTLELNDQTSLELHEIEFSPAELRFRADTVASQTESFIACYTADGARGDLTSAPSGLVVEIDGNPYELFGDVRYGLLGATTVLSESVELPLTCDLSFETDLKLVFDNPDHGGPVSLRRAVQFDGANPSPLLTNDVVICNGGERATPRPGLNLDLQPWFPGLAALYDSVDGPVTQDWVDAGFGPLGDVFGDNTVRFGSDNVLTVETDAGFSCRTFPVTQTNSLLAGLPGDDWFKTCINPDGIFCDAFQRDESLDGLAVVIERVGISQRSDLEFAVPGGIVDVQLRAINLGDDPVDGRVRWYPMMEVCDEFEACDIVAADTALNTPSYDIPIVALSGVQGSDEVIAETARFVIPATAQPGDRYRIVASSFIDGAPDPQPALTRAQLVIEVTASPQ